MQKKRIISLVFFLLLLGNFVFSFIQYYNTPLYGDITVSVLPDEEHVQRLLDDPFGLQVLITGEKQFNPNRYFSHLFLKEYFRNVPSFFQKFAGPISSVYLSSAMIKITIQILFIFLLALFISGEKLFSRNFLLSAVIIAPLFQIYGYWSRMGIVDKSVAYTFFYALPIVLLMLFFLPVFNRISNKANLTLFHCILLAPLIIVLPFTGPLNPPVILLVSFFIFYNYWFRSNKNIKIVLKTIPKTIYILLIPINLLSGYSLFLGLFDSSFASVAIPLTRRFSVLPDGIFSQLFHSLGFPLLLIMIGVNVFLMKRNNIPESKMLIQILKWIGIFALIYILLLPFGGYRPYRPKIIRYDTFIPITIGLIYFFGASSYLLLNQLNKKVKKTYVTGLIFVLLVFVIADFEGIGENSCERMALQEMASSKEKIIEIPKDCFVISWENKFDYQQSEKEAELINFWGITDKKILFYNKQ